MHIIYENILEVEYKKKIQKYKNNLETLLQILKSTHGLYWNYTLVIVNNVVGDLKSRCYGRKKPRPFSATYTKRPLSVNDPYK